MKQQNCLKRVLDLFGRRLTSHNRRPTSGSGKKHHRSLTWLLLVSLLSQSLIVPALYAAPLSKKGARPHGNRDAETGSAAPSHAQDTETITVYGPRRIESTGLLTKFNDLFTLPADANAPFTLLVQNGLPDGSGEALIGNVKLNGSPVFSSTDLHLQVPSLSQQVTLGANNTLEASFLSRRAASLTITITATRHKTPLPSPVITDFNPKRGTIGTAVTLTGTALKAGTGPTVVTFAGPANTRVPALVSNLTETSVLTTVPNGAITGPIELRTDGGQAATSGVFTVSTPQDFQLTVAPAVTTAIQRGTATQVVTLTSQQTDFTQLARLSASGLPNGVAATFEPSYLTNGATSTLSLSLASVNLSPGSYSFNINGTASVEGHELVRSAAATLNVMAAGQTTLAGRVLSTDSDPIMGATISLDGQTTTTDAAGSFLLSGVTAGPARPLMIDGRTASAPNRTYPLINEPANIVANQANVIPYVFYLPPIDVQYEVDVVPGRETVATNPRVENLQMTIPAGANLRNRDGSPVVRASITPLQIDRTPTPLPAGVTTALVYTSQPGGAITSLPIPVVYPNLTGANPGTRCALYAFNHDTVQWYIYGYGRVSADGRTIVPETDPATGRPYGLKDFSWHFPGPPPGPCSGPGCNPNDPDNCGGGNYSGNPVNLSSGVKVEKATDISFGGARGLLTLQRIYTSDLGGQGINGAFGRGATHSYDIRVVTVDQAARVIFPGEQTGRLFTSGNPLRASGQGPSEKGNPHPEGAAYASFRPPAIIGLRGDELRKLSDGTYEYVKREGDRWSFNSSGRLTKMTDPNGNTVTLTYSGNDLVQVTDPVGRSITFEYGSGGRISRVTDPLGQVWRYEYDNLGSLTSVTDPLSNITRYAYNSIGRLTSITDPRGQSVKQIAYNNDGRVTDQTFADGGVEHYEYFLSGTTVTKTVVTDALGRKDTKQFNFDGYVISHTDPLGQTSRITRSVMTNLPLVTEGPCGCTEATRQFDDWGNVISMTDRLGQTMRLEYEHTFNRITRMTDRLGHVTSLAYDARGNLTAVTNALNQTTTFTYDANGLLISATDPLGHTVRMEYDASGNASTVIDALGNRTALEYDALGRPVAATDPLGRRETRSYDALDRLVTQTDTAGQITRFRYDPDGNLERVTNALGYVWSFDYDAKSRLISETDPLGRVSRMEYDADDELTASISPSGRSTRYTYDARGQVLSATNLLGESIRYTYDNVGNLSTLLDQRGSTTTFKYDELFRLVARFDPLGQATNFAYDANGNMTAMTDRLGRRTAITYDPLNRTASVVYPDATASYAYDAAGRLSRIDDTQGGSASWSYDDAGRMMAETTPAGVISYSYNAAGETVSMTAANRAPVTYNYDAAGRLQTIAQGSDLFIYTYDALSRVAGLQRPNGVRTSYTYNPAGQLERLAHLNGANQAIEDYRYSYNSDDELEAISSLASAHTLPAEKSAGPADANNRLTQFGTTSFGFNGLGQTTSKTAAGTQGTTNYEWDARGRMTRATLSGGQSVSYAYDALGRRTSRTVSGVTTTFLYDGDDVVLDRSSDGSSTDYLSGIGIDDKLRQSGSTAGSLYFLQDHLGSTAALTNQSGAVVERMQYGPFGESQGSALTRYGYTGRERDAATGLQYNRARWYDPSQGRFITEDPLGFAGGDTNLYAYVGNNPISFTDPTGHSIFGKAWNTATHAVSSGYNAVAQTAAGFGDRVTFGGTRWIRQNVLHNDGGVDYCSGWYKAGGYGADAWNAAFDIATLGEGAAAREGIEGLGNAGRRFEGGACFVAGTKVQTPAGEKAIEDITSGDLVLSADPEDGKQVASEHQVTRTFVRIVPLVLDIKVEGTTITATPEHPFWVISKGWQLADELESGSQLLTTSGETVRIDSIKPRRGLFVVYNLEVEHAHTYYVSTLGILVHNSCFHSNYTPISNGVSRAPKQGIPNSIYEQLDNAGKVRSRTFYDANGHPFTRQDFDHSHGGLQPHQHSRTLDASGHPITQENTGNLPPGYGNRPTPP